MKNNLLLSLLLWFLAATTLMATNIKIENIEIVERNNDNNYIVVEFDLSWDYSFRVEDGDNDNWDAAWVFMKYKNTAEENVSWGHAILADEGHVLPSNYTYNLGKTGTQNKGMFVYRSNIFNGRAEVNNMRMRWNYGENGVPQDAEVDIRIFGIEMVYVPQGRFFAGSGGDESAAFQNGATGNPFQITSSTSAIENTSGNLWANGGTHITAASLGGNYPTGHAGFYMMKHSITQQAYVDFLNTLSPTQQSTRLNTGDNNNRRNITVSGNEYSTSLPYVPVNHLSPEDLLAYLDWSSLRPYTELEYEKAARGPSTPVGGEYAWGNTRIGAVTALTDPGAENEGASASGFQRDIFVDPSRVSETLENFTVLVRLNEDNFDFDNAADNGADIRFFSTDGTELPFERERHNKTAKRAEYWVTLPQLNSVQTTVFTMEYGGSGDDSENISDTWALTDLVSLWHLHESGETFSDSKGVNHGTAIPSPLAAPIHGQIGPTRAFDGSNHIAVPDATSLDITDAITLSAWVKPEELHGVNLLEQWSNHWNSSQSTLDNLRVQSNHLELDDPTKHLGHRIVGPISLDAIKSAGSSEVNWDFEPGYTIQAFKEDGFFKVPEGVTQIDVLVVAGGGGGGVGRDRKGGGGGGAGGVVFEQSVSVNSGNIIPISVGQGGRGGLDNDTSGENGGDSSFGTFVEADGGGRDRKSVV